MSIDTILYNITKLTLVAYRRSVVIIIGFVVVCTTPARCSHEKHPLVHANARQIGARAQRPAQHIRLRAAPSRQLTARVHIQRRLAVSHTAGAPGGGRQTGRVAGGIFAPGARNYPIVEENTLMAAERCGGGLVGGGAVVVRIAYDLAGQAVVIPPQQLEHGAEEDPLEFLPEDAVDDEVHRAVHSHQEVGGLRQRQEDFPGMLKFTRKKGFKKVTFHYTSVCLSFLTCYFYSHSHNFGCLIPKKSISCFYNSKFSKLQPFPIMFSC
jgi:hypothetical protein